MPEEEKFRLQKEVQEQNLQWLQWKFSTLPGASWIMVVDGQVIEQGKPKDFPSDEQLLDLIHSKAKGKYPFCFVAPTRAPSKRAAHRGIKQSSTALMTPITIRPLQFM